MFELGKSKRRSDLIFRKILELGNELLNSITELKSTFNLISNGKYNDAIANMVKIKSIHEVASSIREEIFSSLYTENFLPDLKETLLMLTQNIYSAIGASKDATRVLISRRINKDCTLELSTQILSYLVLVEEAVKKLISMLDKIQNDIEDALKIGKQIQAMEREGDEIKDNIIIRLYEMEGKIDIISLLQMKDFILNVDDILDNLEEATVSIELLYATLRL
ncbi:MAG: DUF47 family protein [Sulfolobaceae archaeon]